MRVLLITENQAAAVRVDRGQVDAVAAQQRQQKVRADVTEVAGNDAVKVPRLCAEILQQRGKGVGSSGRHRSPHICRIGHAHFDHPAEQNVRHAHIARLRAVRHRLTAEHCRACRGGCPLGRRCALTAVGKRKTVLPLC